MDSRLLMFYRLADIDVCESELLMILRESCEEMEERVRAIAERIPDKDRQELLAYIDLRDELELELVKEALYRGWDSGVKNPNCETKMPPR